MLHSLSKPQQWSATGGSSSSRSKLFLYKMFLKIREQQTTQKKRGQRDTFSSTSIAVAECMPLRFKPESELASS